MIDLRAEYGDRYRITMDEAASVTGQTAEDRLWLYEIPGKYGHVYIHGCNVLGAYVRTYNDGSNRLGRLLALPGATLHQRGDREASVVFDPTHLDAVAGILQLRRRRRLTEKHKAKLAEAGKANRFAPRF